MSINIKLYDKTRAEIYKRFKDHYPHLPDYLFNDFAALFETIGENINAMANDLMEPRTREAAYLFAAQHGYEPLERIPATVELTITLHNPATKEIPAGYQVGGISTATGHLVYFELSQAASFVEQSSIKVFADQKRSFIDIAQFEVETPAPHYELELEGYYGIIKSSITVNGINNTTAWTRVDNFDSSGPDDLHYIVRYKSNDKCYLLFGDGIQGKLVDADIYAINFALTEGLTGRMGAEEIKQNIGGDGDIKSVTNEAPTSGGSDAENVKSIIRNARVNSRLRDAVWSKEDLETVACRSSQSIIKALGIPAKGAASLQAIPKGGSSLSSEVIVNLQAEVREKTQFGVMPITVVDANYINQNITAEITTRNDFDGTLVKNLTEFALTLFSSPYDIEVIDYYDEYGIDETRSLVINSLWPAWSFNDVLLNPGEAVTVNDGLEFIINLWVRTLGEREFREWGQPLEVGDLWIAGNSLYDYGVDVFNLTSPTTNLNCSATEIIKGDTVAVTDVTPA